jgi:hypothetical protein
MFEAGRSIGTMGSRFIGTIFVTLSSRSLQSPAEEVLGIAGLLGMFEVLGYTGAVGFNGATGGGGKVGAIDAGSRVAPLGGRTRPLDAGAVALA